MRRQENILDNRDITIVTDSPNSKDENNFSQDHHFNGNGEDKISKYFNENYDDFDSIYNIFEWSIYIGIFSFIGFLISLLLDSIFSINFYIIGIFAFAMVFSTMVIFNLYLKMKGMLDSAKSNNSMNLGNVITYICFNIVAVNILTYLILLILRHEKPSINMSSIAIPLYIAIGFSFVYYIFILPALFSYNLWADIILYFLMISGGLSFLILLNNKIDYSFEYSWIDVGIPLLIIISYVIIYSLISHYIENKQVQQSNNIKLIINILSYSFLLISVLLFFLNKDHTIMIDKYLPFILLLISGFFFVFDKAFKFVFEGENGGDDQKEEIKQTYDVRNGST